MAMTKWIICVYAVLYLVDIAVDGALWPGVACSKKNEYILDDQDISVYYRCSNNHPYRMKCFTGLCPCIGQKCNKAIGTTMYCTWLPSCHRPTTPAKDPCMSKPCHNSGRCKTLSDGSYHCECLIGYSGATCKKVTEVTTFVCQNGIEAMPAPGVTSPSPSNDTFIEEECKTWCFVRENSIEQSVTRGCWYPELFGGGSDSPKVPTPQKGCGFFNDKLAGTLPDTDQMMCFCRRHNGQCNTGSVDKLVDNLPFLESM